MIWCSLLIINDIMSVYLKSKAFLCGVYLVVGAVTAEEKVAQVTEYIRVEHTPTRSMLQTGVTTYQKGDVRVDFIGAVHIADKAYFKNLNREFTHYDALLFEMVGGEQLVGGKAPEDAEENKLAFLGAAYQMMEKALDLSGQKDHIDYAAKNFVHADLSLKEFQELQKQRGESILSFAFKQAKGAENQKVDASRMLSAILSRNPAKLKLQLMDTLAQGDNQIANMTGENVIVGDRNIKCLDVLDQQVKAGKKKLGIFYGAAHFPDMEKRLIQKGYVQRGHRWLTAWDVMKEPEVPKE